MKWLDDLDFEWDLWWQRNIVSIILAACVVIVAMVLASLVMAAQTMALNARITAEIKALQVQQNTNAARIQALADEQSWIRNSVKIKMEMMK